MRGGFTLEELAAAAITTIDIIVVYAFLQMKRGKLKLVMWTVFLNMLLPFFGFLMGEISLSIFTGWSTLLSSVLLGLIGLHMLLQDDDELTRTTKLHPVLIAGAVSMDSLAVSVSFGMLHMNKLLFIIASGLFALVFAYLALHYKERLGIKDGKLLRRLSGLALLVIGIMTWLK